tara:strand:+ start:378 stop:749 length:372 start_codon:yes stop_codon:yes gene_type:complete
VKPEVKRMIDDPRLFDPQRYVELQDVDKRDEVREMIEEIDFTKDPDFMRQLATEVTERPLTKRERLKQIEIDNLQSIPGSGELSEVDEARIEKNVNLQMFNTSPMISQMSPYVKNKLKEFLRI